jgi:hypothetical protein
MKPGTSVKMLTLESAELAAELQQDLGVLGMQAVPRELRTWVTGVDLPLMPIVPLFLVDICFCVCGYKFYCHKVAGSTVAISVGKVVMKLSVQADYLKTVGNICSIYKGTCFFSCTLRDLYYRYCPNYEQVCAEHLILIFR